MQLTPLFNYLLIHAIGMAVLFVHARRTRNWAVVDVGWTAGVGIGAFLLMPDWQPRSLLILAILLLWSTRLSVYLLRSRVLSRHVDKRYANMEKALGARTDSGFLLLFLSQTILVGLFLLPWLAAIAASNPLRLLDVAGILLAILAITGEAIADKQLAANRHQPVCNTGLWAYSRHPNYFFEWLHWSAYILLTAGSSYWPLGVLAPLTMYVFLFYITGIPHLEREALRSRGDAYRNYQQTTNRFWPWIPRKQPSAH